MTATDVQLRIRPPMWARVWVTALPILFAGLLLFVVRPEGNAWLGGLVAFLLCPALAWRLFRLAAIGTADGTLVVRNHWRDRTLRREDVAEVTVGNIAGAPNRSVHLRLHDGSTVRLDVTESLFVGPFRGRLERQATAVRDWISGARST